MWWFDSTPWWLTWLLVAAGVGLLFSVYTCCMSDNYSEKKGVRRCALGFCCVLPCLWIPCGCFFYYTDKSKCKLCTEEILDRKLGSHLHICLEENKSVYEAIPDSQLYACQNGGSPIPLKLWPSSKLKSISCIKCDLKCDYIKNTGRNLHYCFLCGNGLCSRHHPKETEGLLILDMQDLSTIPEKQLECEYMDNVPAKTEINQEVTLPLLNTNGTQPPPSFPPIENRSAVVEVPEDDHQTPSASSTSFQSSSSAYNYSSYMPSTNAGSLSAYQPTTTYTSPSSNFDNYSPTQYSDELKPAALEIPDDCLPSYEDAMKD